MLRRPDRSINDAKELKDIKVNGKRKIAEIANRKKDEAIRKLELEASDLDDEMDIKVKRTVSVSPHYHS